MCWRLGTFLLGPVFQLFPSFLVPVEPRKKQEEWSKHWITHGFVGLEKVLAATSKKYCVGDTITMADYYLAPMVFNAYRYGVDVGKFPNIERLNRTLLEEDSFKETHPSKQIDAKE